MLCSKALNLGIIITCNVHSIHETNPPPGPVQVSLSSLNRHALATRSDVGLPKVTVMEHRLREFAGPGLECESINALCNVNNVESLIQGSDYVLDCIDDQGTKIDLLEACQRMNIKVICALGAGGKVDPTRICLGNLSDTSMDPMAQRLRAKIAHDRRLINMEDIEAVYSVEEPKATLLDLTEEQTINPEEFGAMPYFRVRIMPVLGTSPALFGISMAARVITNIAQHGMFTPIPVEGISKLLAHACSQRIRNQELKALGKGPDRFVDEDCMYVIAMCRKRCQITGSKMIGCGTERLELARWWSDRPLTIHNAILVRKDYVDKIYQYHAANRASGFAGPTAPRGHDLGCDDKVIKRIEQWLEAEKTVEFNM